MAIVDKCEHCGLAYYGPFDEYIAEIVQIFLSLPHIDIETAKNVCPKCVEHEITHYEKHGTSWMEESNDSTERTSTE